MGACWGCLARTASIQLTAGWAGCLVPAATLPSGQGGANALRRRSHTIDICEKAGGGGGGVCCCTSIRCGSCIALGVANTMYVYFVCVRHRWLEEYARRLAAGWYGTCTGDSTAQSLADAGEVEQSAVY